MKIHVNGEPRTLFQAGTVLDLLEERGLHPARVAVEINEELVPRAKYGETWLASEDRVEIVTFVGGG